MKQHLVISPVLYSVRFRSLCQCYELHRRWKPLLNLPCRCSVAVSFGVERVPVGAPQESSAHSSGSPFNLNALQGPDPTVLNGLGPVFEATFPFAVGMHRFNKGAALVTAVCEAGSRGHKVLQAWAEQAAKVRVSLDQLTACCEDWVTLLLPWEDWKGKYRDQYILWAETGKRVNSVKIGCI